MAVPAHAGHTTRKYHHKESGKLLLACDLESSGVSVMNRRGWQYWR
jgi:hypothetical protein